MASIDEITAGIVDLLDTTIGLRATDYVPEQINPPAAIVRATRITEETFGQGSMNIELDVVLLTARTSPRIGTTTLNELITPTGTQSLWDVLNAFTLPDGTHTQVLEARSIGVEEIGLYSFLGWVLAVLVTTPG